MYRKEKVYAAYHGDTLSGPNENKEYYWRIKSNVFASQTLIPPDHC